MNLVLSRDSAGICLALAGSPAAAGAAALSQSGLLSVPDSPRALRWPWQDVSTPLHGAAIMFIKDLLLSWMLSNPLLGLLILSASVALVAAITTCCLKIDPFTCFILFPTTFPECPLVLGL